MPLPEIILNIRAFLIGPDLVRIPMTFALATALFSLAAYLFYRDRQKAWFIPLFALAVCSMIVTLIAFRTLSAPRIAREPAEIFAIQGFPTPDVTEIDCNTKWRKQDSAENIFWPNDPAVQYSHRFTSVTGDSVAFGSITYTSPPDTAYFYESIDALCREQFGHGVRQREVVTMTKSSKAFLCPSGTNAESAAIIIPIKVDPIHFILLSASGQEEELGVNMAEYQCLLDNIAYLPNTTS